MAAGAGGVDADVLAAWLTSLPGDDPIVPPVPAPAPAAPSPSAEELAELWPPAAPVDPFTGIHQAAGSSTSSDWDLAFDPTPARPAPAREPEPAAPAASAASASAAAATVSDFQIDLGGLGGPAPAENPVAPEPAPAPPAAPPTVSPFGPPPPPAPPPAEVLQAPPLTLEITIGRRSITQEVRGEALIGRPDATRGLHPEIDLRLDDAVSRRHAKIFVRNGHYVLTDLNSTNGTRHNRKWLQPEVEVELKPGDEIEVGELTLIRVVQSPEAHA